MANKIKIPLPSNYANLDTASQKQFQELLLKAKISPVVINQLIDDALASTGVLDSTFDASAATLAGFLADTGLITEDSAKVLVINTYWDVINDRNIKTDDKNNQKDLQTAGSVGALIGMENARKQLELNDVSKDNEFSKIKKHYGLDDTATKDKAYGMLLEDLEAQELHNIYYGGDMRHDTPMPLSLSPRDVTGWEEKIDMRGGLGVRMKDFKNMKDFADNYIDLKFTEELFGDYLYREKKKELIGLSKTGRSPISNDIIEETAKKYASDRAKKGYEMYQNYQVEVLKDVQGDDIDKALTRLASKAELDRQKAGIFTDDI